MKPTIQDLEQQIKELQDTIEKMKANKINRAYDDFECTFSPDLFSVGAYGVDSRSALGNFTNYEDAIRESERLHLRAEMNAKLDELWGDERPEVGEEYHYICDTGLNVYVAEGPNNYPLKFKSREDRAEFRKQFTDEQIIFALTEEF